MKRLVTLFFLLSLVFLHTTALAKEPKVAKNKYFDAIKVYFDKDHALNDTIEFAVFDMSDTKIINDSPRIATNEKPDDENQNSSLSAQEEIQASLDTLPKYFYQSLKQYILANNVPVTLFPSKSPEYALPLKLYIKVKRIHLKPFTRNAQGQYGQPVEMRIYGQIKDEKTGKTLIKYYDAATSHFVLGNKQAPKALASITQLLMSDLALYLKTKY
ncbi:MAG: hypothetical protein ABII18_05465 [bacterium]